MNAPDTLFTVGRPRWRGQTAMQRLGQAFYTPLPAQPLPEPHWVARNWQLAEELGLGAWLQGDAAALALLAGNAVQTDVQPLATVYSGHQFGAWAGQLGDGRALLLGELDAPRGPQEIQLKGSGLTPYSRRGDGRAVLRSSIREYLCSEAMHALGVPTTRALALVGSPLPVQRETVETAAVLTRVAPSFLRFGHFEHFAHSARDVDALQRLTDHVIDTGYPHCRDAAHPVAALLEAVARSTAELIAAWQSLGFCHGVMNTDNMSIFGLTIDYGPFGFLDAFDPGHICNHTDFSGRYAYARQPQVALWNLHALALALLPLVAEPREDAQVRLRAALDSYPETFSRALDARMGAKFGLFESREGDRELIDEGLRLMVADRVDFTITFRALCDFDSTPAAPHTALRDLFIDRAAFEAWALRYAQRLREQGMPDAERAARMRRTNPKFVLRNHLAEVAIRRAREGDFSELERLAKVLERPFDEQPEHASYAAFPPDWAPHLEVSCSS